MNFLRRSPTQFGVKLAMVARGHLWPGLLYWTIYSGPRPLDFTPYIKNMCDIGLVPFTSQRYFLIYFCVQETKNIRVFLMSCFSYAMVTFYVRRNINTLINNLMKNARNWSMHVPIDECGPSKSVVQNRSKYTLMVSANTSSK